MQETKPAPYDTEQGKVNASGAVRICRYGYTSSELIPIIVYIFHAFQYVDSSVQPSIQYWSIATILNANSAGFIQSFVLLTMWQQ
ncbi:hypothetical protein [Thalassomonas sp. RHCl1]|uniref:hypothetical protein n=1 Tax=Thalassomonas sp. RHCl1 TaxID=2995320 RepID=UPI00248C9FEA|nr:hypothetical protein [Thalassomonas sp. RHCl1]